MDYEEDRETAMDGNREEEKVTQERLNELHQILEREWDSFESSSKLKTQRRRYSTGSKTALKTFLLLENSPKKLISSIQQRSSPSQETWNVRNNELALGEILRNRNGRRLFEEEEEMGFGIMEDMFMSSSGFSEKSANRSRSEYDSGEENEDLGESLNRCSYSSMASSSVDNFEKKKENGREKTASMAGERSFNNGGQRFRIFTRFVAAVTSAIFGFCIFSMSKIGENEEILVPT